MRESNYYVEGHIWQKKKTALFCEHLFLLNDSVNYLGGWFISWKLSWRIIYFVNHQAATYFMSRCTKSLDVHLQVASPCFQIYLEIDIEFFSFDFLPKNIKSSLHGIPTKINRLATFWVKFLEHRLWRKQIELSFRFRRALNETDLWSIFSRFMARLCWITRESK